MGTTTALVLNERLSKSMGEWIEEVVTTNTTADNLKTYLLISRLKL